MEYFQLFTGLPSAAVVMSSLVLLQTISAFPTGSPLSACGNLMPVHIDGELQTGAAPYMLILNDTTYGSTPLKLTITAVGPSARDFMAFMLQARSEFGEVAGHFSDFPLAAKAMTCYSNEDTLTHTAAFIRQSMEVVWHPPNKNIGKISITGSMAQTKVKYWEVESASIKGSGPLDTSGAKPGAVSINGKSGTPGHVAQMGTVFGVLLVGLTKFLGRF
ncbi:unnamed protein product [Lymnaea stagnalis]|uniref:Reelin domain-containing protein n=1 Tax=Lymnaea stagnalis TaxID=6523 RepID=A0AAV2HYQ2_LYMST